MLPSCLGQHARVVANVRHHVVLVGMCTSADRESLAKRSRVHENRVKKSRGNPFGLTLLIYYSVNRGDCVLTEVKEKRGVFGRSLLDDLLTREHHTAECINPCQSRAGPKTL